jgi:DNA polymerase elongation subunit (family B)
MEYPFEVKEFAKVRMEQTSNNTQIARDLKNKFSLNQELDHVRKTVSNWRKKWQIESKKIPIKRLFFDIETGYYILKVRTWQLKNFNKYFNYEDIEREKEILCISYKWQNEDGVHTLDWRIGEKEMLKQFIKILGEADEAIAHNGDKFDLPFLRTRCLYHGVLMFPTYRTLDTLKKSRNGFRFASNKLDYLLKFTGVGSKVEHEGFDMWKQIIEGTPKESEAALEKMIEYCEGDVIGLADYYAVISPFITHNNNFAVLVGGDKWDCPECGSHDVELHHTYTTAMGIIRRQMKCNDCRKQYKISNKNYMGMLEHMMRRNNNTNE